MPHYPDGAAGLINGMLLGDAAPLYAPIHNWHATPGMHLSYLQQMQNKS